LVFHLKLIIFLLSKLLLEVIELLTLVSSRRGKLLFQLSLKGLLLLGELLVEFTLQLMSDFILDFRLLLNKLISVFFHDLGSNVLLKLSLGIDVLLLLLLGMEFGLILGVLLSQDLNLLFVFSFLLFKEIFSFMDGEMGILWGKSEVLCHLLSQNVLFSEWNLLYRGSVGICLDVIHIIFHFLGLFSFKVGDFHPLVELLGLSVDFGIIDMNLSLS
jgi:hypothetical protein